MNRIFVNVDDDDDDDDNDNDDDDNTMGSGGSKNANGTEPTCKDYMIHFVTFFWKFLFAFVPPTSKSMNWYGQF
jgi:hypothetical protein